MAITWIAPVDKTPGRFGAWVNVDCSANISAGATGVILHIDHTAGGAGDAVGVRKNGSTDARTGQIGADRHFWSAIGVDGARIFEANVKDATFKLWLVGYFEADAVFNTNAVDKSLGTTGVWLDIDISADTGTDTAIAAIWEANGGNAVGFRKNGSTDSRIQTTGGSSVIYAIIGVDASEICEGRIANVGTDFFLAGYIKSAATLDTNATDLSLGTTGSWLNLSSLPTGATGGFIEIVTSANTQNYGLRKDGTAESIIHRPVGRHNWGFVEAAALIVEGRIDNLNVDFFLVGYAEAAAGDSVVPQTMRSYRQRRVA